MCLGCSLDTLNDIYVEHHSMENFQSQFEAETTTPSSKEHSAKELEISFASEKIQAGFGKFVQTKNLSTTQSKSLAQSIQDAQSQALESWGDDGSLSEAFMNHLLRKLSETSGVEAKDLESLDSFLLDFFADPDNQWLTP